MEISSFSKHDVKVLIGVIFNHDYVLSCCSISNMVQEKVAPSKTCFFNKALQGHFRLNHDLWKEE